MAKSSREGREQLILRVQAALTYAPRGLAPSRPVWDTAQSHSRLLHATSDTTNTISEEWQNCRVQWPR